MIMNIGRGLSIMLQAGDINLNFFFFCVQWTFLWQLKDKRPNPDPNPNSNTIIFVFD